MRILRVLIAGLLVAACFAVASREAQAGYNYRGIRWYGPRYYPYFGPYRAGWYHPWYATPYRFGYGVYHHAYGPHPWYDAPYAHPYAAYYAPGPGVVVEEPGLVAPDDEVGCYYW